MKISMMKRLLVILLAVCTLMTQGNMLAFAAERTGTSLEDAYITCTDTIPWVGEGGWYSINGLPEEEEFTIVWSSSDETVATIAQDGEYRALKVGTTVISAVVTSVSDAAKTRTFESELRVSGVVGHIELNETSKELSIGDSFQLIADVTTNNDELYAEYKKVTWSSSRPEVASVDENGLVTAHMPGSAYIYATAIDGSGTSADCYISVLPATYPDSGVQLYKNNMLLGNYETVNEAFDLMTDETADYIVVLCDGQILYDYPQWPKVNSIKITCALNTSEYGSSIPFVIGNTTFNSDVIFSDWINIRPLTTSNENVQIDIQSYQLTFSEELGGHYPYFGYWDLMNVNNQNGGFHVVGDVGSKILVEASTQTYYSSFDVDVLEIVDANQAQGHSASLIMAANMQDSHVNTYISEFEPVVGLEVGGLSGEKVSFVIDKIEFADKVQENAIFTPEALIHNTGNITVEVKDMPSDASLQFRYESKEAVATGSFAYTGTTAPKGIGVSVNMGHNASGLYEGQGYKPFDTDSVLLYAPNVPSDVVGIGASLQGDIVVNDEVGMIYGAYRFSGSIPNENGYYYTSAVPVIIPSQSVLVFVEETTKTLTYAGANANGDLKSVTWTAETMDLTDYSSKNTTNEIVGNYDNDSVELTYTNTPTNAWTKIYGVFDYGDYKVTMEIPLMSSAPASDVSFSKDKIVTENYMFNYQEIQLNYSADEEPEIFLSCTDYSVVSNLSLSGNTVSFYTGDIGTATIRAYVGDQIVECEVVVKGVEGWHEAMDGNWYYYKDGEVDTSLNGLAYNEAEDAWWYAVEGKAEFTYTGLTLYNGVWYYVENGVLNWGYTGLTLYYGTWYYVENGVLNWGYTGLTLYYDTWYYVEGGVLNWGYTGLTLYYGTWYYVEGGVLNWGYTGLTLYYDTWYYVENGVLNWDYTGLTCYYGTWYYVEGGVLNWGYTGLTCYYDTWYYVEGGVLNWGYTGLCEYYGTWYYIGNGVLDWSFTGNVLYNGIWWYVENGVMIGVA